MEKVLNRMLLNREVSPVSISPLVLIQLGEERQWSNCNIKCPSKRNSYVPSCLFFKETVRLFAGRSQNSATTLIFSY